MKSFIYFFLLVFLPLIGVSQQVSTVRDTLLIPESNTRFYITYGLTNRGGSQQKNGPYALRGINRTGVDSVEKVEVVGNFSSDKKTGNWSYFTGVYALDLKDISRRLTIDYTIAGEGKELKGTFKDGLAEGKWSYSRFQQQSQANPKVLELVESSVQEGMFVSDFKYSDSDQQTSIRGKFNRDHFFDGKWELIFRSDSTLFFEERWYKNGFLLRIRTTDKEADIVLLDTEYKGIQEKMETLKDGTLDLQIAEEGFGIPFDDGFNNLGPRGIAQQKGNRFLLEVFAKLELSQFLEESVIDQENFSSPSFRGTRRFIYTLSTADQELLEDTYKLNQQVISDIEKFYNNTTLALNKQRSDTLATAYAFLENSLERLTGIDAELQGILEGNFRNRSINTFYEKGLEGFERMDTLQITWKEKEIIWLFDNRTSLKNAPSILHEFNTFVRARVEKMTALDPFFKDRIIEIEQEIVSQQLEEDIITSTAEVQRLYDREAEDRPDSLPHNSVHHRLYDRYTVMLNSAMEAYSLAEGIEAKQEKGLEIVALNSVYTTIFNPVAELQEKLVKLDEAYTKYAYNPYMDRHDIKTRVKRTIYNAAVETLIPNLLEELLTTDSFRELATINEELEKTFDRLYELAAADDADTRTIERRLRRENNPNRIKRILDIG
ncbi:MAG: hypothetical protein ACXIT9_08400 [Nitritalea sp.]